MLQKIISIRNVGRFQNCAALGDVAFRRFTLIFAENGRGKSTLCAILRSLCSNTSALIIGRRTLGSPDAPEVQLFIGSGNVTFRNGLWNASYADIAVFDGTYVSENVFLGDVVDTEHRRNLYRIIIGAQGVTLAGRLNELDNQVSGKNSEIREVRTRLQRHMAPGMTAEIFIGLSEDSQIDAKIQAKEQELQAVQRAAQLQQKGGLAAIAVPVFPASFAQLLAKTFASVAVDAERHVAEHITHHQMGGRGQPWLTEGLGYLTDDLCPFCNQPLTGVALVSAYRDFFSKEYHALSEEVTGMTRQVEGAIGDRVSAAIERTLFQNSGTAEFWRQYCVLTAPVFPEMAKISEIMTVLRQAALSLLQTKSGKPLEAVPPDDSFTAALEGFEALRRSIAEYNAGVAAANVLIEARRQEAQGANVRDVEVAVARLKSQKARYTNDVSELCAWDARLQAEKTALESAKETAKEQLDAHTEQVITSYGQSINLYLERINAGFRITTPTHSYRGRTPSSTYQIVINESPVDLGDAATPADRPSFRNTLSAGDKSTLALAFFLAQLEQDVNRARKTVVLDDPFSSLDRRSHTAYQVLRCGERCAQVVVLSHEPAFLKQVWDIVPPSERKTLQLARVREENTTIVEWDIEKAVQARYRADLETLQKFFSLGDGERRDVIQKLRPVLEGYCRNLYPTQFEEQDTLGVMVGKIRTAGVAHPLSKIADDLDEMNVYCRRYHHAENPNAATEPIHDAELQSYVKRTLKLVGCLL